MLAECSHIWNEENYLATHFLQSTILSQLSRDGTMMLSTGVASEKAAAGAKAITSSIADRAAGLAILRHRR